MTPKSFSLSVKVVILDDNNRCLLLKRAMTSMGNPGKWDLPGGKVDSGESFDEGLLREVSEETGLTISLNRPVGFAASEAPNRKVIYLFMEGRLEAGQVQLSSEHEDFVWIDRQELAAMELCVQFQGFAKEYSEGDRL